MGAVGRNRSYLLCATKKNLTDEIAFAINLWDLCQYDDFPIGSGENIVHVTPEPEEYSLRIKETQQ